MIWKSLLIAAMALATTSCSYFHGISARTHYLGPEHLASVQLHTPDPRKGQPYYGQRLIVSWDLPSSYMEKPDLHLLLQVRYRDHSEMVVSWPLLKKHGTYTYDLLGEAYDTKGGIMTYKVQVLSENHVLEEWVQKLWVDLIKIEE